MHYHVGRLSEFKKEKKKREVLYAIGAECGTFFLFLFAPFGWSVTHRRPIIGRNVGAMMMKQLSATNIAFCSRSLKGVLVVVGSCTWRLPLYDQSRSTTRRRDHTMLFVHSQLAKSTHSGARDFHDENRLTRLKERNLWFAINFYYTHVLPLWPLAAPEAILIVVVCSEGSRRALGFYRVYKLYHHPLIFHKGEVGVWEAKKCRKALEERQHDTTYNNHPVHVLP